MNWSKICLNIMFDLRKIPMLRVLVPFFGGVLCGFRIFSVNQIFHLIFLAFLLWILVFAIFKWQGRSVPVLPWLISPLLCLLFFIVGAGTGIRSQAKDPVLPVNQVVLVKGEVSGSPREGSYAQTFEMKLHLLCSADSICIIPTLLKCYLPMPADSLLPAAGETWLFAGKLVSIRNSRNPGSPDYRSILGRKNCWYRFYASTTADQARFNRKLPGADRKLAPARIRSLVSDHWHGSLEEVSLLKAVCLGDQSSLSDDIRQAYATAGGMHLLAVSGLHVGLIWWVLHQMTGWMSLIFRKGVQRTVLIIGLLWFYAFITGFSSSVCRSVTMFSFFSVGRMLGERVHPLNVILTSAFLLVLIEPLRLMDVGFQLSYAAIIGIITLHPLVVRRAKVKNRFLRRVWEATSVSLAAQLSTAPLVIYYFHYLPTYSMISSLIAIPLLSLLMAVFVCSVPFIMFGILEELSSVLLVELARLMNRSMELLSSLPGSVTDGLQLNSFSCLVWLLLLLLGIITLYGRRRMLYYMGFLLTALLLVNSFAALKRRSSSELIVSHFKGASMVIIREGVQVDYYCWYRDSTSRDYMKTYIEQNWSRRIYEKRVFEPEDGNSPKGRISSCIQVAQGLWFLGGCDYDGLVLTGDLNNQVWGRVYADSSYNHSARPHFILLSGEPAIGSLPVNRDMTNVDLLIDGSNRSWYKERVMAEWDRIYLTDQLGAYVKRW